MDEQIKLISLQSQLERDTGHSFASMSVSETISKCLQLGHGNRAAKIKSEYKVPDKRYFFCGLKKCFFIYIQVLVVESESICSNA